MILAIDGYEANVSHRVGIGRYAYEILCWLHALLANRDDITVRVYLPSQPRGDMPKAGPHWMYCVRKPSKLWTFIALPLSIYRDSPKADVVFSPTHYVPRFISTPRVMSVMDLSYLYFPELFRNKDLLQLTEWTKYSVSKASAVLTISEYSKNDIIKMYGKRSAAVHVTYPGLSMPSQKKDPPTATDIFKKYSLPKRFILSVGTIQPRKNYEKLIEAFSLFLKAEPEKSGDINLVIIGKKGWLFEGILRSSETHGVKSKVKFLDFVPDGELPTFYRCASCFALPSLYEGFGLPVLEAMANECPVVVSNVSSLPEIAGDAGIYVDPNSPSDIASGLVKATRERNQAAGRSRVRSGLKQVQRFTWEKAAKQTLNVLEQVAAKRI